jgi:hypothetical protein
MAYVGTNPSKTPVYGRVKYESGSQYEFSECHRERVPKFQSKEAADAEDTRVAAERTENFIL